MSKLLDRTGPEHCADLADDDCGADRTTDVRHNRQRELARLRVRHGDAVIRRIQSQPIRAPLLAHRIDVLVFGGRARADGRRHGRLVPDLGLHVHRNGRSRRLHHLRAAAARDDAPQRTCRSALRGLRGDLLVLRLQRRPPLGGADARARGGLGRAHHRPRVRRPRTPQLCSRCRPAIAQGQYPQYPRPRRRRRDLQPRRLRSCDGVW